MTDSEVEDLLNITAPLTKRKVLAFMQAQYDPLGLVAPLLLKGKVMLRKLYGKEYTGGWDDPLKSKLATEWLTYIKELVRHGPLNFPRTVITEELRELWLVGFWDGSSHAHSAVIYARCWNVNMWDEETFDSNLLVSKTRVAPITGSTIPRMELQGLLQLSRLMKKAVQAMRTPITRVILAGDSLCCIMALKKDGMSFNPFFQNRLTEINENLSTISKKVKILEPVQKIAGTANPADLSTRTAAKHEDLAANSPWQKGPDFLCHPKDTWPLTDTQDETAIPPHEIRKINAITVETYFGPDDDSLTKWIQRRCTEILDLEKAKGVIARCLKAATT